MAGVEHRDVGLLGQERQVAVEQSLKARYAEHAGVVYLLSGSLPVMLNTVLPTDSRPFFTEVAPA